MRLTIRTKLLAGFAAVIAVMVGSMGYAIYALNSLDSDATTIAKSDLPSSGLVHDIRWSMTDYSLKAARYVLNNDPKVQAAVAQALKQDQKSIAGDFAKYRAQYAIDAKGLGAARLVADEVGGASREAGPRGSTSSRRER